MTAVFVSYTQRDRARVANIIEALKEEGLTVDWDQEFDPGSRIDRAVTARLTAAGAVLVLWSPDAVDSDWVMGEADLARQANTLVPALLAPTDLPPPFRPYLATDLTLWKGNRADPGWRRLVETLLVRTGTTFAQDPEADRLVQRLSQQIARFAERAEAIAPTINDEDLQENVRHMPGALRARTQALKDQGPYGLFEVVRAFDVFRSDLRDHHPWLDAQFEQDLFADLNGLLTGFLDQCGAHPVMPDGCVKVDGAAVKDLRRALRAAIAKAQDLLTTHPLFAEQGARQALEADLDVLKTWMLQSRIDVRVVEQIAKRLARVDVAPLPRIATLSRAVFGTMAAILPDYAVFVDRLDLERDLFGPEMVLIPAGTFLMGSPEDEERLYDEEGPQHEVTISARFALARYPVTFEHYDVFCRETGRDLPGGKNWGRGRQPVIDVDWDDARAYCDWVSEQSGRPYGLPTEAQWEYACRAGTQTARYGPLDDVAWYGENSGGQTQPVGQKTPNAWGLYDMLGNVYEWCDDAGFMDNPYTATPKTDPAGPQDSDFRALRGVSWYDDARNVRAACRGRLAQDSRGNYIGFRCARVRL